MDGGGDGHHGVVPRPVILGVHTGSAHVRHYDPAAVEDSSSTAFTHVASPHTNDGDGDSDGDFGGSIGQTEGPAPLPCPFPAVSVCLTLHAHASPGHLLVETPSLLRSSVQSCTLPYLRFFADGLGFALETVQKIVLIQPRLLTYSLAMNLW